MLVYTYSTHCYIADYHSSLRLAHPYGDRAVHDPDIDVCVCVCVCVCIYIHAYICMYNYINILHLLYW